MNKKNILIGSFVRMQKPHYLTGTIEEVVQYNGNALMFFLGSPQRRFVIAKNKLDKHAFEQKLKQHQIQKEHVVVHLPYLINLANMSNDKVLYQSINLMEQNLQICQYLGITKVVLHPGSALKNNRWMCLKQVAVFLDQILSKFPDIFVCLETMSGQGSELGKNFEELKLIIDQAKCNKQLAVCFDLCHLYSAGYDLIRDWDKILNDFEQKIGLAKLLVCHLNDSKTPFQSHKDRHANIGQGYIGLAAIKKIIHHPLMKNKIMILETPYINNKPPYKEEIAILLDHE